MGEVFSLSLSIFALVVGLVACIHATHVNHRLKVRERRLKEMLRDQDRAS